MLPDKLQGKEFQDYLYGVSRLSNKLTHVNYVKTVEHAKEMAVHAWGEKPIEILERSRPREDPEIKKYRLDSWEPITLSKFEKAISILQKIFNPKLYSIIFPPQPSGAKISEEETLEKYILENYPEYDSLFMFCREVLLKQMISDPNGVIAVVPTNYNLPQNQYQSPTAILFNSEQVLDFKKGEYFVLMDKEKSKDGGFILHVFNKNQIITLEEVKENSKFAFREFNRYDHNFDSLPIWFLGGITNSQAFPYYYSSFFKAALPHWNKAIRHESDLDGAYVNHLHPQKWEYTIDCDYSDGDGGMCYDGLIKVGGKVTKRCSSCHGTGRKRIVGPYDVYSVNKDGLNPESQVIPPAGYIQGTPVEIVEKLENRVEKCINYGLEAINMDIVNMIGANQSGIAKEYDRTELNSFMQQISDYIFDNHIPNIIHYINRYRYEVVLGKKYRDYEPIISKPTSFDTLSIKELTAEISDAKTAKVSPDYITALEKDAAAKRFSTNSEEREKILAILDLNPFNNFTIEDKMNMTLDGTVSKIDITISNNITQFVERAIQENKDFLLQDRKKQKEILKGYANEILNGNQTSLESIGLSNNPMGISDTPVDVEAEAKAKLKGSVGGVQGILEIQKQVSEGITTYSAGLAILDLIYGIGDTEGRRILGDEKQITRDIEVNKSLKLESQKPFMNDTRKTIQ